jgi:plasmid stability protein
MPDFLLRDLPEDLMAALKQRAERNRRSLQIEIRQTLADSVPMTREQWFAAAAALRAKTRPGGPDTVELIRQGREERDAAIDRALSGDYDDLLLP